MVLDSALPERLKWPGIPGSEEQGASPQGAQEGESKWRKDFLRRIGYKL
jgi:hypothetical protein